MQKPKPECPIKMGILFCLLLLLVILLLRVRCFKAYNAEVARILMNGTSIFDAHTVWRLEIY